MAFSSKRTFNRLTTMSPSIDFDPKWLNLDNVPLYAIDGHHAPTLELFEVVSSVDPDGRRFLFIGQEKNYENINIVVYETSIKDKDGGDTLYICYIDDSLETPQLVMEPIDDERLDRLCHRFALKIDSKTSLANKSKAKLLHPSVVQPDF